MSNTLDKICADKRDHIDAKMLQLPLDDLKASLQKPPPTRSFINALKSTDETQVALIAEVKKASPSKGVIRENFDPVEIAKVYQTNGVTCLSVLTDEPYFQGHDDYFRDIRKAVNLPMLRKDFIIDDYQVYESSALGADCILLIMACLTDLQAERFYGIATSLGMDCLFEVHDEKELSRALDLNPQMVGVNNRNLKTLEVDVQNGLNLSAQIPNGILKVAESGIIDNNHIQMFRDVGFGAFLVGESLMRQNDIGWAVKELLTPKVN